MLAPARGIYQKRSRRVAKGRRAELVRVLAAIMREAEPTYFALEGPLRHAIRSAFCEAGSSWAVADASAADLVGEALRSIGAKRPRWEEGQPEWTQPGAVAVHRDRCIRCHKPLDGMQRLYCSQHCKQGHLDAKYSRSRREERNAAKRAREALWMASQPDRQCEGCGAWYRPKKPKQRFCRAACAHLEVKP